MKKWLIIALCTLLLTGCSWNKILRWFENLEFEREDQTVRIVDIFFR